MSDSQSIILVSGSPRRKELLEMMGLDFIVDTDTSFREIIPEGVECEKVPEIFAEGKSLCFHRPVEKNEVLVSADTVVICDGKILGKPAGKANAVKMLQSLSGKSHKVVSAVCVRTAAGHKTLSDTTIVTFKELSDAEIKYYVDNFKPFDKAGAYGIQEWLGEIGITSIHGSFYTVMGLPTHLLYAMLRERTN